MPNSRFLNGDRYITTEGIYPVFKPKGCTSFSLIRLLRKQTQIRKIGHAGTLDPLADGVMILLIGPTFTKQSDQFLHQDKEYRAEITLGVATTTYDAEGEVTATSDSLPSLEQINQALTHFQGTISQIPPMFSAKKIKGKKLYELARKGIEIERPPQRITLKTTLVEYQAPVLTLEIVCTKGTYIRSIAYDLGVQLGCHGHLSGLTRTRCGPYTLADCYHLDPC